MASAANRIYFAAVADEVVLLAAFCCFNFRNAAAFLRLSKAEPESIPFAGAGVAFDATVGASVFAFLFDCCCSTSPADVEASPFPFAEPSSISARLLDPLIARTSSGSYPCGLTSPSSSSILRTASMNSGVSFEPIPFLPSSTNLSYSYTLAFGFGSSVAQLWTLHW